MKNTEFEKVEKIYKKYLLKRTNKEDIYKRMFLFDALIKYDSIYTQIINFVEYAEKNNFSEIEIYNTLMHDINGLYKGDKFFVPRISEY
jgi:hypothetical protein